MAPEHLHPLATASLPWQIVLAIIAFNIVAGMLSKRKKRPPKADPIPGSQGDPKGDVRRRLEEARARSAAEAERKAAEKQAGRERDQGRISVRSQTESSSKAGSGDRSGNAGSGRDGSGNAGGAATAAQDPGAKVKEVGRDLLGQLARELGLELPQMPKPVPASRPAPVSRPASGSTSAPAGRSPAQARAPTPGPIAAKMAAREEEGRPSAPTPSPAPLAHPEPVRVAASPLALELADAEALRKAFILKTVLDKPLSLRRRG